MTDGFQARVSAAVTEIQGEICAALEALEADLGSEVRFGHDAWERDGGGGGVTRVIQNGALLEKGGVNVSTVHGELSDEFAERLPGSGRTFFATGVSLVLHPRNPHVPTVHANFRHIVHGKRRWFGGGADLTPYYLYAEDTDHFHGVWKAYCEAHPGVADYARFRDWCDRYFYLPHRQERRGIGGLFFDDLVIDGDRDGHAEELLAFIRDGARAFIEAYVPIARTRMRTDYTPAQRDWQLFRRGRYVEFNLLYDRGTVFGLQTGGRTESILMSLPPRVSWGYCVEPDAGTPEAELLAVLGQPPPEED